ncbi:astacin-like metalloendopeptidase [Spea bombifrons]|uniref:astacin-like metalloendopeptidase n=1 Tax=Spea bombifrons TaxID=233779 RepID=UPI00234AB59A|nr:astacin-like metalloendopeptidase [Spea bombifrons]
MKVPFVIWVFGAAAVFVNPVTAGGKTQRTDDILAINNRLIPKDSPESSFLLEGDIIRNPGNIAQCTQTTSPVLADTSAGTSMVEHRKVASRWYSIIEGLAEVEDKPSHITIIMDAIRDMESSTCLRFVNRTNERDYISIEPVMGCFSSVGRMGGMQVVSLSYECLQRGRGKGVALHELMHVAGFWHEHSRADREDYIQIIWDQILSGYTHNFCKYETSNMLVEYDLMSILHYSRYAFSRSGLPTITPRNLNVDVGIGQRYNLSYSDILRVNKFYSCPQYKPSDDDRKVTIHAAQVVYPCSNGNFSDLLQTRNLAFTLKSTITAETLAPKQGFMKEPTHSSPSSKILTHGSSEPTAILASDFITGIVQDSTKQPPRASSESLAAAQAFTHAQGSVEAMETSHKSDYTNLSTPGSTKKSSTSEQSSADFTFSLASTRVNVSGDMSTVALNPQTTVSEPESSGDVEMDALPEEKTASDGARGFNVDVFQGSMAMPTYMSPEPLLATEMIQHSTPLAGNWARSTMFLQTEKPSLTFGMGKQFIHTSVYQNNIESVESQSVVDVSTWVSNPVPINTASEVADRLIQMATNPPIYSTDKHLASAAGTLSYKPADQSIMQEVPTTTTNGSPPIENTSTTMVANTINMSSVSDMFSGQSEDAMHDLEDKSVEHLSKEFIKIVSKRSLKELKNLSDNPQGLLKFSKSLRPGVIDGKPNSKKTSANLKSLLVMRKSRQPIGQDGVSPRRNTLEHHLYRILKVSRERSLSKMNVSNVLNVAENPQSVMRGALSKLFLAQKVPPGVSSASFYDMHSDKGVHPGENGKIFHHPQACGFENGLCGWRQSVDDNMDWSFIKGHRRHWISTGSLKHLNKPGGAYLSLTNFSKKGIPGARARLLSPVSNDTSCISFWYGSFNHTMGTLNIYIRTDFPGKLTLLWSTGGRKQMEWAKTYIQLIPSYRNKALQVVVEGVTGPSDENIVLDNVYAGQCV